MPRPCSVGLHSPHFSPSPHGSSPSRLTFEQDHLLVKTADDRGPGGRGGRGGGGDELFPFPESLSLTIQQNPEFTSDVMLFPREDIGGTIAREQRGFGPDLSSAC